MWVRHRGPRDLRAQQRSFFAHQHQLPQRNEMYEGHTLMSLSLSLVAGLKRATSAPVMTVGLYGVWATLAGSATTGPTPGQRQANLAAVSLLCRMTIEICASTVSCSNVTALCATLDCPPADLPPSKRRGGPCGRLPVQPLGVDALHDPLRPPTACAEVRERMQVGGHWAPQRPRLHAGRHARNALACNSCACRLLRAVMGISHVTRGATEGGRGRPLSKLQHCYGTAVRRPAGPVRQPAIRTAWTCTRSTSTTPPPTWAVLRAQLAC